MLLNIFATYVPLVSDFPVKAAGTGSLGDYINTIIIFAIGLAGVLAVVMIIVGGVQYVSSDSWYNKDDGKKRIQAAVGGLILALCSYLILNTIDPNLTNLSFDIETVKGLNTSGGNVSIVDQGYDTNESVFYDPTNPSAGIDDPIYGPFDMSGPNGECNSLPTFRAKGWVAATDNGGNKGKISPEIAWLSYIVNQKWPTLQAGSTYRSPAWNAAKGGSKNSAHMRGEAVDFFGRGIGKPEALELVAWARADVCRIGIRQVIYQKTGYNLSGGTWTATGHDDHVHIGR